jgi:hypothetical protein
MMRRLLGLSMLVAVIAGIGAPAQAVNKVTGTIALPAADVASDLGSGNDAAAAQVTCPDAGPLDGVVYRWFDLKQKYSHFKAYGPEPLFSQPIPSNPAGIEGNAMDYDIDLWAFDDKCVRVTTNGRGGTGTSYGGIETLNTKKPVRYLVVTYYSGVHPNLEVTLEYS